MNEEADAVLTLAKASDFFLPAWIHSDLLLIFAQTPPASVYPQELFHARLFMRVVHHRPTLIKSSMSRNRNVQRD